MIGGIMSYELLVGLLCIFVAGLQTYRKKQRDPNETRPSIFLVGDSWLWIFFTGGIGFYLVLSDLFLQGTS